MSHLDSSSALPESLSSYMLLKAFPAYIALVHVYCVTFAISHLDGGSLSHTLLRAFPACMSHLDGGSALPGSLSSHILSWAFPAHTALVRLQCVIFVKSHVWQESITIASMLDFLGQTQL